MVFLDFGGFQILIHGYHFGGSFYTVVLDLPLDDNIFNPTQMMTVIMPMFSFLIKENLAFFFR